jgi:hypothetical protein
MTAPCVVPVLDAVYLNVVAEDWVNDVVEPVRVRNLGVQRQLHPLRAFRLNHKSTSRKTLSRIQRIRIDLMLIRKRIRIQHFF